MDYKFWLTIGASALLGACITGLWGMLKDVMCRRAEAKSLQNGLVAEVKALLHLMSVREYRIFLEDLLVEMEENDEKHEISIVIEDNFNPIFRSNIDKIGKIDKRLVGDIVTFHNVMRAMTLDFSDKSSCAEAGYDKDDVAETLRLMKEVEDVGSRIVSNW